MHHDFERAGDSPSTPHLNALKHGLRALTVLLPGEDAEEFHALREELFELHQPRTRNEVRCVEAMVEHEWSMARCRRIRARYQAKLIDLVEGTGAAHCEKDPHRWHHSAMDCSLDERRIARLLDWQFERLAVLQKLRRQRLIDRVVERAEREDASMAAVASPATASRDTENLENPKRTAAPRRPAGAVSPQAPRSAPPVAEIAPLSVPHPWFSSPRKIGNGALLAAFCP